LARPKGQPKLGGRKKGTLNKVTADVKLAAQAYTAEALKTLADIMHNGQSEQARVAASNSLLDRAWGKPGQAMTVAGDAANPMRIAFRWDDDD
jgi:hypothetical protein